MINARAIIIIILIASATILFFLSVVTWRKKVSVGSSAIYLSICMIAMCVYNFGYAMELSHDTLEEIMWWVRFQHWGVQTISPAWLLFALCVTGREKIITRPRVITLVAIPVLLALTAQTLGGLNLMHINPRLNTNGLFPTFTYDKGIIMDIGILYINFCLIISFILFSIMLVGSAPIFRKQAAIFWIGSLFPFIGEFLYNFGFTIYNLDFTPLASTLSSLIFSLGFLRFQVLDIVPLARDVIFENYSDGVLILDNYDRIVDINPNFQVIFPDVNKKSIGYSVDDVLINHRTLLEFIKENKSGVIELEVNGTNGTLSFQTKSAPLYDLKKKGVGKIITLHDNTQTKQLLNRLEELAALDSLTSIYNRRSFNQLADQKMNHLRQIGGTMSLIMLDLDYFKRINDTYSHNAGDVALKIVTKACQKYLRQADILGRYGGEEFVILLPEIDSKTANTVAERLRQGIEQQSIQFENHSFSITASLGVTSVAFPNNITLEELFQNADRAVYQAKDQGRNRVCACNPV